MTSPFSDAVVGIVITEAGNDPKVAGLVYVAAFAADKGESVSSLIRTRRLVRPCLRFCRLRMATCFSIDEVSSVVRRGCQC